MLRRVRPRPLSFALWLPDAEALLRRHAESALSPARESWPTLGLLSLTTFACFGAGLLLGVIRSRTGTETGSVLVTAGALLLLMRPGLDDVSGIARKGMNAPVTASLALAAMGVVSAWGASFAIDASGFRATPLMPDMAPPWFFVACMGVPCLTLAARVFATHSAEWLARGPRLRRLALTAWGATALLTVAALASGRSEFDAERYYDALPKQYASVSGVASLPTDRSGVHVARFGDVWLRGECRHGWRCEVFVGHDALASAARVRVGLRVGPNDEIELRRDDRRALLLLRTHTGQVGVFSNRNGRRVDVSSAAFPEHNGPPQPWIVGALLGLIVAGALLRRRAERVSEEWVPAHAEGGGVRLADGRLVRVMPPLAYEGAVLVRLSRSAQPVYREGEQVDAAQVVAATPDDLTRAAHAASVTRDAFAFATLALAATPLYVAAARGLVF